MTAINRLSGITTDSEGRMLFGPGILEADFGEGYVNLGVCHGEAVFDPQAEIADPDYSGKPGKTKGHRYITMRTPLLTVGMMEWDEVNINLAAQASSGAPHPYILPDEAYIDKIKYTAPLGDGATQAVEIELLNCLTDGELELIMTAEEGRMQTSFTPHYAKDDVTFATAPWTAKVISL